MQPNLFMWGGLLKSMIDSDLHIVLDNVKASKNSRYNRNRIKGNGSVAWLTVPYKDFSRKLLINELRCDMRVGVRTVLKGQFSERYKGACFLERSQEVLSSTLESSSDTTDLVDLYERFLGALKRCGLPISDVIYASRIVTGKEWAECEDGVEKVNLLLSRVKATTYLAAENTAAYADISSYTVDNVRLQRFRSVRYPQTLQKARLPDEFTPNLSCLDALSYMDISDILMYLDASNSWVK